MTVSLKKLAQAAACPLAARNLKVNTLNRNKAIKAEHIQYGPINLSDKSYWVRLAKHWKTSVKAATKSRCGNCAAFDVSPRMQKCMPGMVQEDGVLGYCHMHQFKCHSKRSCYTWAAGGPIRSDAVSASWDKKRMQKKAAASVEQQILAAMRAEGGAAGMKAIRKRVKSPEMLSTLRSLMARKIIYKHRNGDLILK